MTELKLKSTTKTQQTKLLQKMNYFEKNYNELKIEIKNLAEEIISLNENVETPVQAFDTSLKKLKLY